MNNFFLSEEWQKVVQENQEAFERIMENFEKDLQNYVDINGLPDEPYEPLLNEYDELTGLASGIATDIDLQGQFTTWSGHMSAKDVATELGKVRGQVANSQEFAEGLKNTGFATPNI